MTNDRARWVAHAVNTHNPDFVIHLGDIVHPVPHLPTYGSASKVAQEIMGSLTSPFYRSLETMTWVTRTTSPSPRT